jgi:hypothetical protein
VSRAPSGVREPDPAGQGVVRAGAQQRPLDPPHPTHPAPSQPRPPPPPHPFRTPSRPLTSDACSSVASSSASSLPPPPAPPPPPPPPAPPPPAPPPPPPPRRLNTCTAGPRDRATRSSSRPSAGAQCTQGGQEGEGGGPLALGTGSEATGCARGVGWAGGGRRACVPCVPCVSGSGDGWGEAGARRGFGQGREWWWGAWAAPH